LSIAVTAGVEYVGLDTASEVSAPLYFCAVDTEEGLLAPLYVIKGVGGPYTGGGFRNVEDPSLPEEVGKA
jgi:hypothetical protein